MYEHKTITPGVGLEPHRFTSGFVLKSYHSKDIILVYFIDYYVAMLPDLGCISE